MRTFTAIIYPGTEDEGGFWAECPEVPGASGQGETKEECLDSLKAAIKELLSGDDTAP